MRPFLISLVFLIHVACKEDKQEQFIAQNFRKIIDSLKISNMLACYEGSGNLIIIEFDPGQKQMARKLSYRKEFPLYIDTLSYIKPNEFRSKKEDITYLIKDTGVVTIQYVKIFHPNSNLRGQTPWTQPYVNTYKRLDK